MMMLTVADAGMIYLTALMCQVEKHSLLARLVWLDVKSQCFLTDLNGDS